MDSKELDKLNRKLAKIEKRLMKSVVDIPNVVTQELAAGAVIIRNTIIESMRENKHGITYKRGKKSHQASAPGEAPAVDTGAGLRSIVFDVRRRKMEIEIGTAGNAPYLAFLEGGTSREVAIFAEGATDFLTESRIAPRPWLGPAVEKHHKEIIRRVGESVFDLFPGKGGKV